MPQPWSIDHIHVILKVSERCNINCTYCYYFNMGEESAFDRPKFVSMGCATEVVHSLALCCKELKVKSLEVSFHGGEPMMIGVRHFDDICMLLRKELGSLVELDLYIQTNGTVKIDPWLDVFRKHHVKIGFSLDGNKVANDRYRLTKKRRSTFELTELNLLKAMRYAEKHGIPRPSLISVIDPKNNYSEIYTYFRSLGVKEMNFLLPDMNHDATLAGDGDFFVRVGQALIDVLFEWLREDDESIRIQHIDAAMKFLRPNADVSHCLGAQSPGKSQIVVARTDATFAVDDSYIPALQWYKSTPTCSASDQNLHEFFFHPIFEAIDQHYKKLPLECKRCRWVALCQGGDLENRYAEQNGFNNKSVYCDSYLMFYDALRSVLMRTGLPEEYFPVAEPGNQVAGLLA